MGTQQGELIVSIIAAKPTANTMSGAQYDATCLSEAFYESSIDHNSEV